MGTATGILSETASKFLNKKDILAADINSDAIKLLEKRNFNAIKTNLFSKIKDWRLCYTKWRFWINKMGIIKKNERNKN